MVEELLSFEHKYFPLLNNWQSDFLDNALWLFSGWIVWIPFVFVFFFTLIYKKPIKEWLILTTVFIFLLLICLLITDVFLKPYFARLRPTYHPDFMDDVKYLFEYKGSGLYGFISGHATFSFALATFTTLLFKYKPWTIAIFVWASIMAYSRVYLGVHFITDILAGAVAGAFLGHGAFYVYNLLFKKYICPGTGQHCSLIYSIRRKKQITLFLIGYILLFIVFSKQITAIIT